MTAVPDNVCSRYNTLDYLTSRAGYAARYPTDLSRMRESQRAELSTSKSATRQIQRSVGEHEWVSEPTVDADSRGDAAQYITIRVRVAAGSTRTMTRIRPCHRRSCLHAFDEAGNHLAYIRILLPGG